LVEAEFLCGEFLGRHRHAFGDYNDARVSMKTYSIILFTSALLLPSFHSFSQQDLHTQALGTIVRGQFVVGKKNVFLPDGDWTLISASETTTTATDWGDVRWANLWLAQLQGKSLHALVRVAASIRAERIRHWTGTSQCDRTNVLFVKNLSRSPHDHFCNVINHRVNVLTAGGKEFFERQAFRSLELREIRLPSTMIVVEYYRSAISPGNNLRVFYYFNPELDGFSPSANSSWGQNDWHKSVIDRDAKKVAYIDALKSWATAMAPAMDAGFKGDIAKARDYSGWPFKLSGTQAVEDQKSPEDRLRALKNAYDQGLITSEEYEAKRGP